jgi:phosphatidylinositol alpha-mannosyltransferase
VEEVKVALVSPYSLSVPGGVQGQVLALARSLRRAGHEAFVVGPLDAELEVEGLPRGAVVGVGGSLSVPANGSVVPLALSPAAAARTVSALARLAPDVVHLHEPLAPGPTWAALLRPGPKVGTFHRAGEVRGARVLRLAAARLASRLSARTAVSEEARRCAQALADGEYEIVGNGIDLERFRGVVPAERSRSRPAVLFVGRHERRKGLGVLLEAFALVGGGGRAELWVAGDGPQSAELRRRFPPGAGVQWLGRIDDVELARRLVAADVLCAPSLGGESFGLVLLEAMAARAVVVASDIPGYAALVGPHGVLVPVGDVAALARALGAVLDDVVSVRGRAAPAALDAAAAHAARWSMPEVARRYLAVYRRVLEHEAGEPARPAAAPAPAPPEAP